MYVGLDVKDSWCKVILVTFGYKLNFLNSFEKKFSNVTFCVNVSSGSRVVFGGRTDTQTDT